MIEEYSNDRLLALNARDAADRMLSLVEEHIPEALAALTGAREVLGNVANIDKAIEGLGGSFVSCPGTLGDTEQQYHNDAMRTAAPAGVFHWNGDAVIRLCELRPEYVTEDTQGELHNIVTNQFVVDVRDFLIAAQKLDQWKSALFYDKFKEPRDFDDYLEGEMAFDNIGPEFPLAVHALTGIGTESAELLEDLLKLMRTPFPGDVDDGSEGGTNPAFEAQRRRTDVLSNMVRETGDIDWYQELLARWLGVPVSQSRRENIDRLRKRFPDKFSEADAVARADEDFSGFVDVDPADFTPPAADGQVYVSAPTIERRSDD